MNEDLHGSAPDKSHAALLLVDLINDLDFPAGHAAEVCYTCFQAEEAKPIHQPNVVLFDMGFPAMDGRQLASSLRRKNRRCRLPL